MLAKACRSRRQLIPRNQIPIAGIAMLKQLLLYFTVTFVLEEVAFRGALDSYTYQPNSWTRARPLSLAFRNFRVGSIGYLARALISHWSGGSIRSCAPGADHCPYFDRRAAFFLLESQRHIGFASWRAYSN